jgi:hypothetical protein
MYLGLVVISLVAFICYYSEDHTWTEVNLRKNKLEVEHLKLIEKMKVSLAPKELRFSNETTLELEQHQFLHLHQMKTGGTSMDRLLSCVMQRLRKDKGYRIPYGSIHECSHQRYYDCRDEKNSKCNERLQNASFMSYCAPVKDLPKFSWNSKKDEIHAITVMRDPIDRVWSMYRFQTKGCYKCMNLTDVYDYIDNGTAGDIFGDLCLKQIQNHETANMLSTEWPDGSTDQDLINQAIYNMKTFFTAIGLLENLNETTKIFGKIFPWFKEEVDWSNKTCAINHANASPKNNRCGPNNSHWDLPAKPDEKTRLAIEDHNQLDMEVYKDAVKHFQFQKLAVLEEY